VELIRNKLSQSTVPLKLADVIKGLPRPKKVKPADFQADVLRVIDGEYSLGRVFRYPSGPKGVERFWAKDEKRVLQDAAAHAAEQPKTMSALKTAVGKSLKGTDPGFIEEVLRGMIGEDRLFEHPPKTKSGGPQFATFAPPPPLPTLERPKFKKKVEALAKSAAGLMSAAGVAADELFTALRARLVPGAEPIVTPEPTPPAPAAPPAAELDHLILAAVAGAGPGSVLSLADLRRQMPEPFRGPAFTAAVLRLADEEKVRIYQDSDPLKYTPEERAEFVTDTAGHVFTIIAKRGE
jgi:hypothetical protein